MSWRAKEIFENYALWIGLKRTNIMDTNIKNLIIVYWIYTPWLMKKDEMRDI